MGEGTVSWLFRLLAQGRTAARAFHFTPVQRHGQVAATCSDCESDAGRVLERACPVVAAAVVPGYTVLHDRRATPADAETPGRASTTMYSMTKYLRTTPIALLAGLALIPAGAAPPKAADPKAVATSIDGYRWEFPCKGPLPDKPKEGADCESGLVKGDPKKTDNFAAEKVFGGEKGKRYKVTLRFRGVVEPMTYKNGKKDGDYFYIGGEPDNATYNIYKLSISSPKAHYFLNRQDKVGHRVFTIDYQKTIEIDGGATVAFLGDGQNGRLISNFPKLVVPDVAPAPKPFNGQFVQMDVVEVAEAK